MSSSLDRSRGPQGLAHVVTLVLEQTNLVEEVRALQPRELQAIVNHVGVEDAGELLALVSTDQLLGVFDDALWKNRRAGEAETFDPAEFGRWLAVLFEAGDAWVAERLAALPEDLLALAVLTQVWVFEGDALTDRLAQLGGDDDAALDRVEKQLADSTSEELFGYELIARRPDTWDLVVAALTELDREHAALVERLLARLAQLTSQRADDAGGLSELLSGEESLLDEVAGSRQERRATEGFVPAEDALAYLRLAARGVDAVGRDALTAAYFRRLDGGRSVVSRAFGRDDSAREASPLQRLLAMAQAQANDTRETQKALPSAESSALRRAMQTLDAATLAARQHELAYLANVLVAGATIGKRRVRPVEAVRAAIAIVEHGMTLVPTSARGAPRVPPLDELFRAGWADLHRKSVALGVRVAENDLSILLDARLMQR